MPPVLLVAVLVGVLALVAAVLVVLAGRRSVAAERRRAAEDAAGDRARVERATQDVDRRAALVGEREAAVTARDAEVVRREATLAAREDALAAREDAQRADEAARLAAVRAEVDAARRTSADVLEAARRSAADAVEAARLEAARTATRAQEEADDVRARAHRDAGATTTAAREEALAELARTAGLEVEQAREELRRRLVEDAERDVQGQVRRVEAAARRTAQVRATRAVATAVQRLAVPTSAQVTLVSLPLPAPELKGRIIGKEGRNIRSFEALTGVNVLVDEVPGTVVLSGFDAERREVARATMEALLLDGRISPPRIEAAYAQALEGADERAEAAGHAAAARAGVSDLHPELVTTLGRLRLRTSFGQNVLEHLVECALLAAALAAEIGADPTLARRGAFLHDVGKALTAELPGTHAEVGALLARRCGEGEAVVNAIAAHHDEVRPATVEAVLVQVADALSAARPGARHDELDQFVERMGRLEALVAEHGGVRRALAMSAGREVRVVVEPEEVRDEDLPRLAEAIARHIEGELSYPGEIRVTVVRELRASATAG